MKLNSNGKLARFYCWSYDYQTNWLPNNFCEFFWELVFAMVLFPITWLSYPFDCDSLWQRFWSGIFTLVGFIALAFGIDLFIEYPFQFVKVSGIIIGVCILAVIFIAACVWLWGKYDDHKERDEKTIVGEISEVVKTKIESVKENYCPKIDWK